MPTPQPVSRKPQNSARSADEDAKHSLESEIAYDATLRSLDSLRQDIIDAIRSEFRQEALRASHEHQLSMETYFGELKELLQARRFQLDHALYYTPAMTPNSTHTKMGLGSSAVLSSEKASSAHLASGITASTASAASLIDRTTSSHRRKLAAHNKLAFEDMAHSISTHIQKIENFRGIFYCCWRGVHKPDSRLARFVLSPVFTSLISIVIVFNTALMGYETDLDIRELVKNPSAVFQSDTLRRINLAFTAIYACELILRIVALRLWFFIGEEWRWDLFDMLLVITSIVQELLENFSMNFVRAIRIFRIIRVARIIRVLRFFRELRHMVVAIASSLAALSWAFVLMSLLIMMFAIFNLQGAISYIESSRIAGDLDTEAFDTTLKGIKEYYGNLFMTIRTLFEAISGGDDWRPMANILAPHSELYRIAFICYIAFVVFGVLNVLTGIFVAAASDVMDRDLIVQKQIDQKLTFVRQMKQIFDELDVEKTGVITWTNFHEYLQDEELQAYFKAHDLDPNDARLLFTLLDHNNSEEVDITEFAVGCVKLQGVAKSMHVLKLMSDVEELTRVLRGKIESVSRQIQNISIGKVSADPRGASAALTTECSKHASGEKQRAEPTLSNQQNSEESPRDVQVYGGQTVSRTVHFVNINSHSIDNQV